MIACVRDGPRRRLGQVHALLPRVLAAVRAHRGVAGGCWSVVEAVGYGPRSSVRSVTLKSDALSTSYTNPDSPSMATPDLSVGRFERWHCDAKVLVGRLAESLRNDSQAAAVDSSHRAGQTYACALS